MLFTLLQLPMQILWNHNFPPLIFVMIVGTFSTTPPIIVHGIYILPPQRSLPCRNMKFKGIDKRLVEVMPLVHAEARTGYLDPIPEVREQEESIGKDLA